MSLYLTAQDRRHVVAAQEAMLAPLEYEDRDAWMLAVNDRLRDLVGSDHIIAFFLNESGFEYVSNDTDTEPLRPLDDMVIGWDDDGFARFTRTEDRASFYFELFHRLRRAGGSGAYHERQANVARDMKRTDHWQSMFSSIGVRFMTGLSTPLPVGEATTCVAYERGDAKGYGEEGLFRLQLLVPAYQSGIRAWRRMAGYRHMFDSIRKALAVFGPGGRVLFRSRGLDRLLSEDPGPGALSADMERLARSVTPWRARRGRKSSVPRWSNTAEVTTGRSVYRLWASRLRAALFGVGAVLVQVERAGSLLPPASEVQAHFGLTRREAEVALLLAEGLDNQTVAKRLSISPHTVRRHTERVLRGLGISSRAAVAMKLLG